MAASLQHLLSNVGKYGLSLWLLWLLSACQLPPTVAGGASPKDAEETALIYVKLGRGYTRQGNYEYARQRLNRALELAPRLADVHDALGFYFSQVDEPGLAEQHFQQAIETTPEPRFYQSFGQFLCRYQRYQEAQDWFQKAVKNPQYNQADDSYELSGLCWLQAGDAQQAEIALKKALVLNTERPRALLALTQIYFSNQQLEQAEQSWQRMYKVSELNATAYWLGVQIAWQQGRRSVATQRGQALTQSFPDAEETLQYRRLIGGGE